MICNMLALMLNPHYKGLQCIRDCVGRDATCQVVVEYDVHVLPSLLRRVVQFCPHPAASSPVAFVLRCKNSIFDI